MRYILHWFNSCNINMMQKKIFISTKQNKVCVNYSRGYLIGWLIWSSCKLNKSDLNKYRFCSMFFVSKSFPKLLNHLDQQRYLCFSSCLSCQISFHNYFIIEQKIVWEMKKESGEVSTIWTKIDFIFECRKLII